MTDDILIGVRTQLNTIWPAMPWSIDNGVLSTRIAPMYLRAVVTYLHAKQWRLGSIVPLEREGTLLVRYLFYATAHPGWAEIVTNVDALERTLPSITATAIAADRFEREIEDLFSVHFSGHPRLGDFVFHDDMWAEGVGLMRPEVDVANVDASHRVRSWRPHRVLEEEGAFVMPVGPIFSGEAESALFLLETVGEEVVRSTPRLFYKYRAIEKLAEGKAAADVLLLVERCNGTSAFGNAWGYCRAVERSNGVEASPRAQSLRVFLAELERVRHHMTALREICASTALTVAASQSLWIEEQMLRTCGELTGHRYLFGLLALGGMTRDFDTAALAAAADRIGVLVDAARRVVKSLANTSSFLDRIERVGIITQNEAKTFELVGPLARASGVAADMRFVQPYGGYAATEFSVPAEREGDGYARLRVLFAEMEQSLRIMRAVVDTVPDGSIRAECRLRAGRGLGWTEAPRGASVHWVQLGEDGSVERYRLTPPSFRNWHGFHIATEGFAFQDFPIILATLDLSVAENDR